MGHGLLLGADPAPLPRAASFEELAGDWAGSPDSFSRAASFTFADVRLAVDTDDPGLIAELVETLGTPLPPLPLQVEPARAMLHAAVRANGGRSMGHLRLTTQQSVPPLAPPPTGPDDLLLGLASPESPFERLPCDEPAWTAFAFKGEREPLFAFRDPEALFALTGTGRTGVVLLLLHRLMQLRPDVVFFHAASVALGGAGVLFVGPKGSGKSTTSLALATRGHGFLGDETAAYVPATGEILPMRRPVGIKPGPRAQAIGAALVRAGRDPDRDGLLRVPVEAVIAVPPAASVALRDIVFLEGFRERPSLTRIEPGRHEIARLQPSVSSLVNAPRARRVFEMAGMLSRARVYRLWPGDPDETARLLEGELPGV